MDGGVTYPVSGDSDDRNAVYPIYFYKKSKKV